MEAPVDDRPPTENTTTKVKGKCGGSKKGRPSKWAQGQAINQAWEHVKPEDRPRGWALYGGPEAYALAQEEELLRKQNKKANFKAKVLTAEREAIILRAIRAGATHAIAAASAAITLDQLANWISKGVDGVSGYVEFSDNVKLAEGNRTVTWLAAIDTAIDHGNWIAAAWKLERVYPNIYGRLNRTENKNETTITQGKYDLTKLTNEELAILQKIYAKELQPSPDTSGGNGTDDPGLSFEQTTRGLEVNVPRT